MLRKFLPYVLASAQLFSLVSCSSPKYAYSEPTPAYSYYEGNFHTHTLASDGLYSYKDMIAQAKQLGLDFIAITDHDGIGADTLKYCPLEKDILCIIGEEVSTLEGHMLAVGIAEPIPSGLDASNTIRLIHEQGGIAIASHPGAYNSWLNPSALEGLEGLDAAECRPYKGDLVSTIDCSYTSQIPGVYDSDAHDIEALGGVWNRCLLAKLDFESLADAVINDGCEPFQP